MKIKQTIKKIEEEIEKIQDNYEMGNKEWDKEELLKAKLSGYKLALKDVLSEIDDMIQKQKEEYKRCKEGRTTRMKNADTKNWGMADVENKIQHYREIKQRLKKPIQEVLK